MYKFPRHFSATLRLYACANRDAHLLLVHAEMALDQAADKVDRPERPVWPEALPQQIICQRSEQ